MSDRLVFVKQQLLNGFFLPFERDFFLCPFFELLTDQMSTGLIGLSSRVVRSFITEGHAIVLPLCVFRPS